MAFPTIADADTKNNVVASNASTWTLTYPTNIAADDLLVMFLGIDGGLYTPTATDWVRVDQTGNGTAVTLALLIKKAVGTETGTFSVSIGGSEQGAWRIFRIPANSWYGGTLAGTGISNADGYSEAGASGSTANPDPPSDNPTNWDVEDTLWIVATGVDTSRTISVYPYAGRNTADVSGGSTGATLGLCTTTSAAASLDPGTFTISASDDWGCITFAVRPSATGGTTYTKAGWGKEHGT